MTTNQLPPCIHFCEHFGKITADILEATATFKDKVISFFRQSLNSRDTIRYYITSHDDSSVTIKVTGVHIINTQEIAGLFVRQEKETSDLLTEEQLSSFPPDLQTITRMSINFQSISESEANQMLSSLNSIQSSVFDQPAKECINRLFENRRKNALDRITQTLQTDKEYNLRFTIPADTTLGKLDFGGRLSPGKTRSSLIMEAKDLIIVEKTSKPTGRQTVLCGLAGSQSARKGESSS